MKPQGANILFMPLLHLRPSALLVLLAVLGVACEDKIVIIELSQLAVKTLVVLKFCGRREDTATFGALWEEKALNSKDKQTEEATSVYFTL